MKIVRTLRSLLAIGQEELAIQAGISSRELSRIEKGNVVPISETIQSLDEAFETLLRKRLRERASA